MGKRRDLWTNAEKVRNSIQFEKDLIEKNNDLIAQSESQFQAVEGYKNIQSGWEQMDFLDVDGEVGAVYKQWEVNILALTSTVTDPVIQFFIKNMKYQILYRNSAESEYAFYNTGDEIKSNDFFEIRSNTLILKVSAYMFKNFQVEEFFVPEVNLNIDLRNLTTITQ